MASVITQNTGSFADGMVTLGLHTPMRRCVAGAAAAGIILYAMKQPSMAFKKDGSLKSWLPVSSELDATYAHFLVFPLLAGTACAVFL